MHSLFEAKTGDETPNRLVKTAVGQPRRWSRALSGRPLDRRGFLEQMSISKDEYIKDNLAIVTKYLGKMIASGDVSLRLIRLEDDFTKADVATLKKTLFYALELVSESEQLNLRAPAFACLTNIQDLLSNHFKMKCPSRTPKSYCAGCSTPCRWHTTRPLREINRMSSRGMKLQWTDGNQFSSESYLRQQRAYLQHLKSERIRILKSKSWENYQIFFERDLVKPNDCPQEVKVFQKRRWRNATRSPQ